MEEPAHLSHQTVMANEATAAMLAAAAASPLLVDATFGGGGHSRLLLRRLPAGCRLLALDCDEYAQAAAAKIDRPDFCFVRANFAELGQVASARGEQTARAALFDLGVSSLQLDSPARGFSFRFDSALDMRMDRRAGATAARWLQESDEQTIAAALRDYGEEPEAGKIARALCQQRGNIATTAALANAVAAAKRRPSPRGRHPATRVFQALRVAVNGELQNLQQGLAAARRLLAVGGRLVVIAFHSLEDRVVKRQAAAAAFPGFGSLDTTGMRQVGKMTRPQPAEVAANPRARSACLRVFVKTGEPRA